VAEIRLSGSDAEIVRWSRVVAADAFLDLAIREGHRKMWLFTDEDNHAAKALYKAAGGQPSAHDDAGYWWQLINRCCLHSSS
jgi:hypothetical protein